ncbi:MAG: AMP-binding protein [Ilumatobacteraceae bacterium]
MTDAPINPFEIVEAEVLGVPMKVFAHQPASLRQIWDSSAAHGDNVFLVFEDERITFAQAHRQVRALAHRLSTVHGVRQGDRVAIATRNYPEWAIAYWATVSLGAVAVPLNAWWTGPELAYGLTDSGSVVLFVDDERAERLEPHLAATDVRAVVLIRSERSVPNGELFVDAVLGDDPPLPSVDIAPDDDATIMYTSGTTGRPKGAVQTHRNFGAFLMNGVYRTVMAAASAPPSDTRRCPRPRCSRCRCSTWAVCSRSCCRSRRAGARWC